MEVVEEVGPRFTAAPPNTISSRSSPTATSFRRHGHRTSACRGCWHAIPSATGFVIQDGRTRVRIYTMTQDIGDMVPVHRDELRRIPEMKSSFLHIAI